MRASVVLASTATHIIGPLLDTLPTAAQGTYDSFLGEQTLVKKVVSPDPVLPPRFWPFTVAGDSSNYEVGGWLVVVTAVGEHA